MRENAQQTPELMAPAGDRDALRAAIRAGADAVYFGLQDWNARVRAPNFTLEGIDETIAEIHRDGVRAYVTFNTLVFGSEERAAHEALERLAAARPDALIVQDLGIARWVHERLPSLPLHASTQMTITSASGIDFLRRFGIVRVILARELTLPEIRRIREETRGAVELEVFVHGAICVSYSGQCLSSEAWGGRSANRGQCAQACRLPYDLIVDGAQRDLGDRAYLLSPRDLESYRRIPELVAAGIDGLKIEGRMKSAAYVAAATHLYRRALDLEWVSLNGNALDALALDTRKVFSRGASEGFLGGINHQVLVDGRVRSHRGVRIGNAWTAGRGVVEIDLDPGVAPPVPGDGLLFADGPNESDETGGKVYEVGPAQDAGGSRMWGAPRTSGAPKGGARRIRVGFAWNAGPDARKIPRGCPVFLTHDHVLDASLRRLIRDPGEAKRIPLSIEVAGAAASPLVAVYRDPEGREARVESPSALVEAERHGLDEEAIAAHLGRLGDTRYALAGVRLALTGALALPVREMNGMRRAAVAEIERLRGGPLPGRAGACEEAPPMVGPATEGSPVIDAIARADDAVGPGAAGAAAPAAAPPDAIDVTATPADPFIVLCRTREQVEGALDVGVTRIDLDFLDLVGLKAAAALVRRAGAELTLCPPRIQKPGEEKIWDFLLACGPDAILVRNLASLEHLASRRGSRPLLIADASLNAVNRGAIEVLCDAGCARVSPGWDLNGEQILDLAASDRPERIEVPLHHHLPLFHTEHCVFAATLSDGADWRTCGRPCDRHKIRLRDRTNQEHAVIADVGCRNTVFEARGRSLLPLLPRLRAAGVRHFRIELLEEDLGATRDLISRVRP